MEKLTVVYQGKDRLTVTNKRDGVVQGYYDRNIRGKPGVISAVIQKYPKKVHPPVVLVGE